MGVLESEIYLRLGEEFYGFLRWQLTPISHVVPSIMIFVFYTLSFTFFTYALKKIDISLSYAIWAGAGTALITIIGIFYFKEPSSLLKITSIGLIIVGVVGLNLSGAKS